MPPVFVRRPSSHTDWCGAPSPGFEVPSEIDADFLATQMRALARQGRNGAGGISIATSRLSIEIDPEGRRDRNKASIPTWSDCG
jgi:hypothetical protein